MLFAKVKPVARKDRRSNYVLVQWIEEGNMMGFVMVIIRNLDKNTNLFAGTRISLSIGYGSQSMNQSQRIDLHHL